MSQASYLASARPVVIANIGEIVSQFLTARNEQTDVEGNATRGDIQGIYITKAEFERAFGAISGKFDNMAKTLENLRVLAGDLRGRSAEHGDNLLSLRREYALRMEQTERDHADVDARVSMLEEITGVKDALFEGVEGEDDRQEMDPKEIKSEL